MKVFTVCALFIFLKSVCIYSEPQKDSTKNVKFDFRSHFVTVTGLYTAKKSSKKNALQAEIEARNIAVSNIKTYIAESCEKRTPSFKDSVIVSQNLREVFRSHGSIIYPNTQLKILLKAPISKVFEYKNLSKKDFFKDSKSNNLIFRFPNDVPGKNVICGATKFTLEKTYYVAPHYVSLKGGDTKTKVIELYFDENEGELKVKAAEDRKYLRDEDISDILEDEEKSNLLYLPAL